MHSWIQISLVLGLWLARLTVHPSIQAQPYPSSAAIALPEQARSAGAPEDAASSRSGVPSLTPLARGAALAHPDRRYDLDGTVVPLAESSAAPESTGLSSRRKSRASAIRMVKAGGSLSRPETQEHIRFAAEAGFNALWVYSGEAGRWTAADAPNGPFLYPDFLRTADWCSARRVRIAVSVSPVADSRGSFVFHDRTDENRILRFFSLLRSAGVRDFVLSFDDVSRQLVELDDVLRYGLDAAPAHLDLTSRLERSMRRRDRFWLCASVYCDAHLKGTGAYVRTFLERVPLLPRKIGIVWTGPSVISRSVTGSDIASTRSRLGGRALLLYDNYPTNDDIFPPYALGLILGPLRHRDAAVAHEAAVYLACPMTEQLGASRLPLLTAADYLADPENYQPDRSWRRAILRLAGADPSARRALYEQALEWGGWIGEPDYQDVDRENPAAASDTLLEDPEERWSRTVRLYPDRMIDLARVADVPFRRDVLAAMTRRLAVARAAPLARLYFEDAPAPGSEKDAVLDRLRTQRESLEGNPEASRAFDAFLEAAGIPLGGSSPSDSEP